MAPFLLVAAVGGDAALQQFGAQKLPFFLKSLLCIEKTKLPTKVVDNSVENSTKTRNYKGRALMVVFSSCFDNLRKLSLKQ